jgi:serine/threonine protein kinase
LQFLIISQDSYCSEKIDLWAAGILLYKLSVAYKPTNIGGYKYGSGPIPFRDRDWKKRSHEHKDLVSKLLEFDPTKRISAEEALLHPWFSI